MNNEKTVVLALRQSGNLAKNEQRQFSRTGDALNKVR
jgi:hypothetical protein